MISKKKTNQHRSGLLFSRTYQTKLSPPDKQKPISDGMLNNTRKSDLIRINSSSGVI